MRRITAALTLLALVPGAVLASTITYLDAPGEYATSCPGGVVDVEFLGDGELVAYCADSTTQQVICGGVLAWAPNLDGQGIASCEQPK